LIADLACGFLDIISVLNNLRSLKELTYISSISLALGMLALFSAMSSFFLIRFAS
jgi:hypothetical protein